MSRPHIFCIRFDELELEQLRAAVVLRRRERAAPVLGDDRALGPFIREAALAAAAAVPGRSEASRITPGGVKYSPPERCAGFAADALAGAEKCCPRAGEYNGFHSGTLIFRCEKGCACHD